MARRIRWNIPRKIITCLRPEPVCTGCSTGSTDPACADFNSPILDQKSYEPEATQKANEDIAGEAELKQMTPPNSKLLELAERFPAPSEWYDE